jgi:hypothetical protein
MPQQLKTISEIAEEQGRMLMLITFGSLVPSTCPFDYLVCEKRRVVLGWLQAEGIRHRACLGVSDTESADAPYLGELYLDLPADTNAPIIKECVLLWKINVGIHRMRRRLYGCSTDVSLERVNQRSRSSILHCLLHSDNDIQRIKSSGILLVS